ncbi:methyl-accepting chemotaxis protein [Idiomarina loihiensis]|uniref:methyl-accepting chemotaxis protein n=1 Tax=Idiomarina TaxID=135575 RepID=UPI000D70A17B|nr:MULTISPECIES: methyl-accepting chemotaxis protein [Idiomarina]PWW36908.1 methyl-accepting chemotaxis protein [Idiomarina loihiensis]TDP46716.1 methyl-accepting chemotaxis protein [Idiomarina loihiensis]TDS22987.1 methyl-accepting chemotaxis protein [Idiomarina sp. H2]
MLRQISIGARASIAFGLIGILILILGIFALNRIGVIDNEVTVITDKQMPALDNVNAINRDFLMVRIHSANVSSYINDADRLANYKTRLADAIDSLKRNQNEYESVIEDSQARELFNEYKALDKEFWQLNDQFNQLVDAGLTDAIASIRENSILPLTNKITQKLQELHSRESLLIHEASNDAHGVAENASLAVIIVLIVAIVLLALFAITLTRSIVSPIGGAVDFAESIAKRDLTQSIEIIGKDEPAQLLRQLERTQAELRNSITTISESSEQLASTSEELSSVTEESTRTIQQQSEELEQAATAVNELTTAVETVAQDAQNASEASDEANQQTQQGNDRVRQTVRAIEELSQEIGDSSGNVTELAEKVKSITKVLEVISGIAEQTNLLALNAAIEAARAGESGRGFAVVADEVRSLAHKTQQSTVEIEDMVKAINESSDRSVATMDKSLERATKTLDVAREAGEALQLIATAVSEINNHNTSIASAAEEQANVSRDVDKNLVSIRDLSNSTASGAEQTNASSRELSRLAVDLNELVKRFRV